MAEDRVAEAREELMVSPTGSHQHHRTGHFLPPYVTSIDGPVAAPSLDFSTSRPTYRDFPLQVTFLDYRCPSDKWKQWVDNMYSSHGSIWRKSGILDAVLNSKYTIHLSDDLILGFAEKWCPSTNSFIFLWGEATLTLEDMMMLGGYSVIGDLVSIPPSDSESENKLKKLVEARSTICKGKSKRAGTSHWMEKFMGSDSVIEHEAFLAYWLSRFVFPFSGNIVLREVLPISVHLARGTKIALAPAVLASIYMNLTSLKSGIVAARKSREIKIRASAPFILVQAWIYERFPSLRPFNPKPVVKNEARLGRWNNSKMKSGNVDVFTNGGKEFVWRPYVGNGSNYGYWTSGDEIDEDIVGLVRCMRSSELVGLKNGCIEQYLPHRVAMQFGMDQDIPGHVGRVNADVKVAWSNYTRRIKNAKVYVPAGASEPLCTTRYLEWWEKLKCEWCSMSVDETGQGARLEEEGLASATGFDPKSKKVESHISSDGVCLADRCCRAEKGSRDGGEDTFWIRVGEMEDRMGRIEKLVWLVKTKTNC